MFWQKNVFLNYDIHTKNDKRRTRLIDCEYTAKILALLTLCQLIIVKKHDQPTQYEASHLF